uniref:Uncharacterized protein n=1 Tax=Rhizophora mucronata TaxID=61149 RepID=A0A2P2L4C4_RHIMU
MGISQISLNLVNLASFPCFPFCLTFFFWVLMLMSIWVNRDFS